MELIIKNMDKYTRLIVELTYELEKSCQKKENLFCSRMNLTPMEFRCVRYLHENGNILASEVASHLGVTRPRITNILNNLEQKKFIQRDTDKKDRRNIQITLNSEGKKFANEMYKEYMSFHEDILKVIGENKMEELFLNLSTFHNVLSVYLTENPTN